MELGASIFVCELPFDGNGILVLSIQVVLHFATQFLGRADRTFQATSDQEPDFNFRHVQPASMLIPTHQSFWWNGMLFEF